jgi:hypothetical protein
VALVVGAQERRFARGTERIAGAESGSHIMRALGTGCLSTGLEYGQAGFEAVKGVSFSFLVFLSSRPFCSCGVFEMLISRVDLRAGGGEQVSGLHGGPPI